MASIRIEIGPLVVERTWADAVAQPILLLAYEEIKPQGPTDPLPGTNQEKLDYLLTVIVRKLVGYARTARRRQLDEASSGEIEAINL